MGEQVRGAAAVHKGNTTPRKERIRRRNETPAAELGAVAKHSVIASAEPPSDSVTGEPLRTRAEKLYLRIWPGLTFKEIKKKARPIEVTHDNAEPEYGGKTWMFKSWEDAIVDAQEALDARSTKVSATELAYGGDGARSRILSKSLNDTDQEELARLNDPDAIEAAEVSNEITEAKLRAHEARLKRLDKARVDALQAERKAVEKEIKQLLEEAQDLEGVVGKRWLEEWHFVKELEQKRLRKDQRAGLLDRLETLRHAADEQ